ncbi:MAG: hypothetical protein ACTTKW_09455, partial [Schwartzia sp. (in: firmicutes)]
VNGQGVTVEKSGTGKAEVETANAGDGQAVLRHSGTGDIAAANVNGQGVTVEKSGVGNAAVESLNAHEGRATVQHDGSGDMRIQNIEAGAFAGTHNGSGGLVVDTATVGGSGWVEHNGSGDIRFGTVQFGDNAHVSHTGRGTINIQSLTAGGRVSLTNRHGGMDLGTIEGHRLFIIDTAQNAEVRADVLRAKELITIFSLHQQIGLFDAPTILDLLLAGDQTREAVGWETSADAIDRIFAYQRRHDVLGLTGFIDLSPWARAFSAQLPLVTLTVGDKDADEEAYLTEANL